MKFKQHPERTLQHLVSAPFIYSMFFPLLVLDIWAEVYHRVCFPLYAIPYVTRSKYFRIDRHRLSYLSWPERVNCMYCGYANGLLAYVGKIAAETEKYWCGIKHDRSIGELIEPEHHKDFIEYNDEEAYKEITPKK